MRVPYSINMVRLCDEAHQRGHGVGCIAVYCRVLVGVLGYTLLPSLFLYGNSMGGAVALHASLNHPGVFAGAVLVAPMVKIADEIRPKEPVLSGVIYLSHLLPWAAVTPTPVRCGLLPMTAHCPYACVLRLSC